MSDGRTLGPAPEVEDARRLRAALDAAIADIRGRHVEMPGYARCDACDRSWPCPDALLADRLEATQ